MCMSPRCLVFFGLFCWLLNPPCSCSLYRLCAATCSHLRFLFFFTHSPARFELSPQPRLLLLLRSRTSTLLASSCYFFFFLLLMHLFFHSETIGHVALNGVNGGHLEASKDIGNARAIPTKAAD